MKKSVIRTKSFFSSLLRALKIWVSLNLDDSLNVKLLSSRQFPEKTGPRDIQNRLYVLKRISADILESDWKYWCALIQNVIECSWREKLLFTGSRSTEIRTSQQIKKSNATCYAALGYEREKDCWKEIRVAVSFTYLNQYTIMYSSHSKEYFNLYPNLLLLSPSINKQTMYQVNNSSSFVIFNLSGSKFTKNLQKN